MPDLWSDLLACLDLRPVPSGGTGEERAGGDVTEFEGRNQQLDYHRVFGGQLLGQFLRIACMSCPDKAAKSQHAVFAREGRADEPIRYQATRHHEGRSFATRPMDCVGQQVGGRPRQRGAVPDVDRSWLGRDARCHSVSSFLAAHASSTKNQVEN